MLWFWIMPLSSLAMTNFDSFVLRKEHREVELSHEVAFVGLARYGIPHREYHTAYRTANCGMTKCHTYTLPNFSVYRKFGMSKFENLYLTDISVYAVPCCGIPRYTANHTCLIYKILKNWDLKLGQNNELMMAAIALRIMPQIFL